MGVKQIVFLKSENSFISLLKALNGVFRKKNIQPLSNGLSIGYMHALAPTEKTARTFNLELYIVDDLETQKTDSFSIEEGKLSSEQHDFLELLALKTTFNYQQYLVEHSSTEENVLVEAGAGTGKTYSMVSRIAYLCNKRNRPVSSLSDEVALMTFTNDAATNMKVRLKQLFKNYFILTRNPKYLKMLDEVDQAHISTIHSFAIGLLRNEVLYSGIGANFRIASNELLRSSFYDDYLSEFIDDMVAQNPNFLNEIPVPIYDLKRKLIAIADRLLSKSVSLSSIRPSEMGISATKYIPFFNDLIARVIIPAEEAYSDELHRNNVLDLKEAIIKLENVLIRHSGRIKCLTFRYLFIDEFQDTDDVQINVFALLQRLINAECRFFIVGDLKQSIYRFRGATISAFRRMQKKSKYRWKTFVLATNYRTDHRLLDRYHPIFSKMGHAGFLPYDDTTDKLVSNVTKESDEGNLFVCVPCNYKDDRIFAEQFISLLKKQVNLLGSIIQSRGNDGKSPLSKAERTIAILVRSNWQVEKLVRAGKSAGIIIETKTGGDLFQLEPSIDMYKLVSALRDSSNPVRLVNLIESNFIDLSLDYQRYRGVEREALLVDLERILDEFFGARIGKTWQQVVNDAYSSPVLYVIKNLYDSLQPWKQYSNRRRERELYVINYEYLIERILESARIDSLTLNRVAEYLKVNIVTQQEQPSRHQAGDDNNDIRIICTTVHKSKGLEYGSVILPFTYEDISRPGRIRTDASYVDNKLSYIVTFDSDSIEYNSNFAMGEEMHEQIQEETRILYVALTRAIRSCIWMKNLDSHPKISWGTLLEA
jgi:ATP-dependent exoDNAse (exonuclease V) beta subunit